MLSSDISSSSLVDSSGSGYDTSLSSSDESPYSGDESPSDGNENSQNDDPIMDEIAFLNAKTRILQRASHILLQHQDYQNLLSLQERSIFNTRSDAIWNEAKEFLRYDDDSGNENSTNVPAGVPSSVLDNSSSTANQLRTLPSSQQDRRIGSQSHTAQDGSIRNVGSRVGGNIDTSIVQRITSQQYHNRLCLQSQVQPIRYNDWLDVCATDTDQSRKSKKRNLSNMVNSSYIPTGSDVPLHPFVLPQEHFLTRPHVPNKRRSDSCCKVENTGTNMHPFTLLHQNSPMLTMAMEPYDSAEDGQNSLSSASRQNNASVVVGTVG